MSSHGITLKKLAEELGLSISTVSKSLNDSYEISGKTKNRVKELAKKYNYKPNIQAVSLKRRQTKTIGVIIPNILNYFFAKVLLGIEKEASKHGYRIITCLSNNKYEKEEASLNLLSDGSVDGFILSIAKETQKLDKNNHFSKVIEDGYPLVMFDRVAGLVDNCDKIVIDDEDAAFTATKHLLKSNCKKIVLLSSINDIAIGKLRFKGFKQAIDQFKDTSVTSVIVEIKDKRKRESAINSLFEQHKDIDGVLTTNNTLAALTIKIASAKGYKIPNDLSVIGFSDDKISRLLNPSLTVIDQNNIEIGKQAVKKIIERIESKSKEAYSTSYIKTKIIARESTR